MKIFIVLVALVCYQASGRRLHPNNIFNTANAIHDAVSNSIDKYQEEHHQHLQQAHDLAEEIAGDVWQFVHQSGNGANDAEANTSAESSNNSVEPANNSVEPANNSVEPANNSVEPANNSVEPANNSVEPANNSVEPQDVEAENVTVEA